MSDEKDSFVNKKYVLVAPDGGWGYMICFAVITYFVTTTAFVGCFGMLFNDFMEEIGMQSTGVTVLIGINAIFLALAGFFTSSLLKVLSLRKLAFIASLIFDLGVLGTVFVKSTFPFYICQGVMQGAGLGLSFNLSCTILNQYFEKRRLLANSFVQAITGLITMVTPMFCKWSLNQYGFRGTMLIITGISLQNIFASAMMQPVEWHMKKVEVEEASVPEGQYMLVEEKKKLEGETLTIKLTDLEGGVKESAEKVHEFPPDPEKSNGLRKFVESFIDLSLCKTFLISCACIGSSLSMFADSTFMVILPQALYDAGWDQDSVTWALSSMLFGDLAMRIIITFVSKWLVHIGCQEIFVMGVALAFISRLAMLWSVSHMAILFFIAFMGVAHCIFALLLPLVVTEAVCPEKFSSALGMTMMMVGLINFTFGPTIGAIRDLTNSYSTAFYVITCVYAVVLLFWSIELLYKKSEHKRRAREESLRKSSQANKAK